MRLFRRRPVLPPIPATVAAVVDDIATTYAVHTGFTARLLDAHYAATVALGTARLNPDTPPHELAMAAAEADGTREALLIFCTTPEGTR